MERDRWKISEIRETGGGVENRGETLMLLALKAPIFRR
jgi:hypothetical protein